MHPDLPQVKAMVDNNVDIGHPIDKGNVAIYFDAGELGMTVVGITEKTMTSKTVPCPHSGKPVTLGKGAVKVKIEGEQGDQALGFRLRTPAGKIVAERIRTFKSSEAFAQAKKLDDSDMMQAREANRFLSNWARNGIAAWPSPAA